MASFESSGIFYPENVSTDNLNFLVKTYVASIFVAIRHECPI